MCALIAYVLWSMIKRVFSSLVRLMYDEVTFSDIPECKYTV